MNTESERSYLQRRAEQERRLSANASDPGSRRIHGALAEMFAARLDALPDEGRRDLSLQHADKSKEDTAG